VTDHVTTAGRFRPGWSLAGVVVGAAGYAAALGPTLLPRTSVTQALAGSVIAAIGYAAGATVESVGRAASTRLRRARGLAPRERRLGTGWRAGLSVAAVAGAAALVPAAVTWQEEQRAATLVPGSTPTTPLVLVFSIAISGGLVLAGRGLRALTRRISRVFAERGWPNVTAKGAGVVILLAGFGIVAGLGYAGSLVLFKRANNAQPVGQTRPQLPTRSGSPASPITWESLGMQGRWFVCEGPTVAQIEAVTGRPAREPIRAYAGIETNGDMQARAREAVADLVRAGGLERSRIVVYTPSTNGYVDSIAAAGAEYVADGDIASVSIQYTLLPSAMSMLFNTSDSIAAADALLHATREAVAALPPDDRPDIYVYGESLGAFGSMGAFNGVGVGGFAELVDGAVWAGPPANTPYWVQLNREASGGPAWQPIVADGSVVRFAADAAGLAQPPAPWGPNRGVVLQNSTDPVVWWSPDLIWNRPAWLDEPRGPDVPERMDWTPLVTFWQVFVDMPAAGSLTMAPGVGHNYRPTVGPAWTAVMQPADWGAEQEARMQAALDAIVLH